MPMSDSEYQKRLAALRKEYLDSLHDRLSEVERCWAQWRNGSGDGDALFLAYKAAHNLAGSSDTFALKELGLAARKLEKYIKSISEDPVPPSAEQNEIFERHMSTLATLVEEALGQDTANATVQLTKQVVRDEDKKGSEKLVSVHRKIAFATSDERLRNELTQQLSQFGYQVTAVESWAHLLSLPDLREMALVVLDLDLQEGNGAELVIEHKKNQPFAIPLVFISDYTDFANRLRAVRAGGQAFFQKPLEISEVIDVVDEITNVRPTEPCRVLAVDDEKEMTEFYKLVLESAGMEVTAVNDPYKIMGVLEDANPDLILLDLYMPGCTGMEIARVIRQRPKYVSTSIVFLSVESDVDRQMSAMSAGGDDFLHKPVDPQYLVDVVTVHAKRARTLQTMMMRDSLTGLLNHTTIREQLDIELRRASRVGTCLVYGMLDLDHFKQVNDTHGHIVGDRVIKALSRMLQQRLRKTDIIGRYGGEEFAIILLDTDIEDATRIMDDIRVAFSQLVFHSTLGEFSVTLSCGLAESRSFADAGSISTAADRAMYEAKEQGRNRIVV